MSAVNQSARERLAMLSRLYIAEARKITVGVGGKLLANETRLQSYADEMDKLEEQLGGRDELDYRNAFERYLRTPRAKSKLSIQDLRILEERATIGVEGGPPFGAYPGSTAGTGIPVEYIADVVAATKYAGPMMTLGTVRVTDNGREIAYPSVNDTSVTAALVTEGSSVGAQDETTGLKVLGGYKINSGIIKLSWETAQDSRVMPDLTAFISKQLGIRYGRYANTASTTGTGSGQPMGFLNAVSAAGTAVGANANDGVSAANTIGSVDCQTLQAALDFSYWVHESCAWQCNQSTLAAMTAQRDKQGALVWPALQNDVQTINGKRIFANPNLPALPASPSSPAATAVGTLALGAWAYMNIRMARPVVSVMDEVGALNGQLWVVGWTRVDSQLCDGGGGAIKYLNTTY